MGGTLNKQQSRLLQEIVGKSSKEILEELLEHFLANGLGSLTKKEMDTFLFYTLDKHLRATGKKWSNHDWSCLLKIPASRIKALKLEAGIRFSADEDNADEALWLEFIDIFCEGFIEIIEKEKDKKIIMTIENPYLLRFIEHQLKTNKLASSDYSFNPERVTFNQLAIKNLLNEAISKIAPSRKSEIEAKFRKIDFTRFKDGAADFFKDVCKEIIKDTLKLSCWF